MELKLKLKWPILRKKYKQKGTSETSKHYTETGYSFIDGRFALSLRKDCDLSLIQRNSGMYEMRYVH